MGETTIREATPDDVGAILRIAERGWNATYGDILSQETIDAAMDEWYDADTTREYIEREDVTYVVAERNGDVVGYVSGGPSSKENVATLGAIYVDPAFWNDGIGTALLRAFEAYCRRRSFETIQVQVLSENEVGNSFYRSHGYEVIDERETELFGETVGESLLRGSTENIERPGPST